MLPDGAEALALLDWADRLNPGPWKQHSLTAARAAQRIAAAAGMDAEKAYVLGALHDIGRYEGYRHAHHVIAGAKLMYEKGYDEVARVCWTHSFPDSNPLNYIGKWDVTEQEKREICDYIASVEMDEYDRLIQLCDAISLSEGVCLMDKRLLNVAIRYGVTPIIVDKWKAFMSIQKAFEEKIGVSIYSLFPEAVENTFGGGLDI